MKKIKPASEESMMKVWPENTICQTLRTIYGKTEDDEIKILCRIAVSMAKKMDTKLREYSKTWDEGLW
jgi:hypothetical protein